MWWEAVIEARKWARLSGLVQTAGETAARSGPPRGLVYHLVVLILIALAPVGLIGGVVVADRTLQSQQRFRERLIERAAATSHALDRDIAIIGSALAATAAAPGVRHWPAGPIWAPGAGSGIYVHVPTEADPPPAVRQVFREARPAVGRSVPGETGDRSGPGGLTIYQPVIDAGTVVAVIGMTLTRAEIDHLLAEDSAGLAGPVAMVDADGEVVAGARDTGAMPSGRAPGWLFAPPRGGHVDPMRYGSWPDRLAPGGLAKVCAVNQPSALASWRLVVCEDREHYDGYWRETLGSSTMILLASVAVGIVSAIVLAQRLALPMRVLSDYARAVSRGKTRPGELPRSTVVEFEVLRLRLAEAEAVLRRRAVAERVARMDARNSERMLSSVLDAMGEAIHVKDFDGRYVMTNAAARYYLGVSETAGFAVGRRVADLFEPATAQSMTALDRDALATDTTQALEIVHYIAGIPRRLAVTKRAWRDYNGQIAGVVTVARDVTEEAEAESRLRMLQADLLRTSRLSSMGAMATGLAHEVNQPLAAASNFLAAALKMLDRTDLDDPDVLEAARAATRDAAAQTCRAGEIVRRLRDFVARGEATLRAEDVGDVLTEACALARANGADERAHLQVVVAADTGAVMIDRVQMQQVLLNLIRNAAEAIGPATSGRITLAARRDDDGRVEIAVSDTGPGPDPTVAGRLFLPFVSTKRHGMGIGLAICHSIVEGHGGMIECLPAPEGGACFRIVLPPAAANGRRAA